MNASVRPAAAVLIAIVAACSNPSQPSATEAVLSDTVTVYAMTGTPASYPTALLIPVIGTVLTDASFNYDIVFDIDGTGRAVLYPMEVISGSIAPHHTVGMQAVATSYDALTRAPAAGYVLDQPLVVDAGSTVAVVTTLGQYCAIGVTARMYGKFAIDAIDPIARSIRLRVTVDPNCTFRSFQSGIPKD